MVVTWGIAASLRSAFPNHTQYHDSHVTVSVFVWSPDIHGQTCSSDFTSPGKVGAMQCNQQLLMQHQTCVPGTYYNSVDRGSGEYEVCSTLACTHDEHWKSNLTPSV